MTMTITLHWWVVPVLLFVASFFYFSIRKSGGQWDFMVDAIIVLVGCWAATLAFLVGHFL